MAKNPYQKLIMKVLSTRPIAFNPDLAHALESVNAGLFLSQLLFWWDKGSNPDWIYKTIREVQQETALSRSEQDTAIKICKTHGLIELELKGIPAKRHFHLNIEKIIKMLENYYGSTPEKNKLVCLKTANKIVDNQQTNTKNNNRENNIETLYKGGKASLYDEIIDIPF